MQGTAFILRSKAIASPPKIAIVVAAAENGVIGRQGKLPWRMPSDLKTFRRLTLGKPIIMGRKTYLSIGKPLDGRDNIVVTRDPAFAPAGVIVADSLEDAIAQARPLTTRRAASEIMIVGGAEIYRAAMPLADRIYLTRIAAAPAGDATFATPDPAHWMIVEEMPIPADPRDEHRATLIVYDRANATPA